MCLFVQRGPLNCGIVLELQSSSMDSDKTWCAEGRYSCVRASHASLFSALWGVLVWTYIKRSMAVIRSSAVPPSTAVSTRAYGRRILRRLLSVRWLRRSAMEQTLTIVACLSHYSYSNDHSQQANRRTQGYYCNPGSYHLDPAKSICKPESIT